MSLDSDASSQSGDYRSFRQITRDRLLFEMLRSTRKSSKSTWKVLIMDKFTVKIMSYACKMADITEEGVSLVEDLYKRRQPLPSLDAIYFIQPTKENIVMFLSDMSGRSPLYKKAYVFFSSPVHKELVAQIKKDSSVLPRIAALSEMNLEYFAIDSQGFITDHERALEELFSENAEGSHKYNACLNTMATRISTVFASMRDIKPPPPIRQVKYNIAGPIPCLGHDAPKLAIFKKRPASSNDPLLKDLVTKPKSKKKKEAAISENVAEKPKSSKKVISRKKKTSSQPHIQEDAEQTTEAQRSTLNAEGMLDEGQLNTQAENPKLTINQAPPAESSERISSVHESPSNAQGCPMDEITSTGAGQTIPGEEHFNAQDPAQTFDQETSHPDLHPAEKYISKPEPSFSSIIGKYADLGEETSSHQSLSEDNRARLKEILSFMDEDANNLTQKADSIIDIWQSIDQELNPQLKAALKSASNLEFYHAKIKRTSKIIAAKASIRQGIQSEELKAKESYLQVQSNDEIQQALGPELEAMKAERTLLEAQLAILNTKIQAHEDKLLLLPDSTKAAEANIVSAAQKSQQLKAKLSNIEDAEEDLQKILAEVESIKSDVIITITTALNISSS